MVFSSAEVQPTRYRFLAGAVFLSLVSFTLSFSRGASYASCRDMVPGHISAHPLDPRQNHITLRTSSSSYLPGQLLIVTVRSSRDFMGFLLQARSVELAVGRPGVDAWTKNRVKEEIRPTRMGPVLMGGHWTLAPPGTHKLRCVSDDDTLTHSDKQLKRNLSFVWKAPHAPTGDFKFYITVVQSYFVYWAGIESLVVRDRSRGAGTGGNVAVVDERNLASLLRERLGDTTAGPWRTLGPTATGRATQSHGSQEPPTASVRPLSGGSGSVTLAPPGGVHLKEQHVTETNSSVAFGPATASRLVSGVSRETSNNSSTISLDHSRAAHRQQTPSTSAFRLQTATNWPISPSQTSPRHLVRPTTPPSDSSTLVEDGPSLLELLSALSRHKPSSSSTKHSEYVPAEQTSRNPHQPQIDARWNTSPEPPPGFLQTVTQTPRAGRQTQRPGAPRTVLISRVSPASPLSDDKKLIPATSPATTESSNVGPTPSAAPLSTRKWLLSSTSDTPPATSLPPPSFIAFFRPPGRSTAVSKRTFPRRESGSSSTAPRNQPKTPPGLSAPPSPSPISTPPHMAPLQPFSSSSLSSSSLKPPSGSPRYGSSVHERTSPSFSAPQHVTGSPASAQSPTTISSTAALTPSFFSVGSTSLLMSSASTSSHPEPSPVPGRSLSQPFTSTSSSVSHQQLPKDQGSLILDPTAPSGPQPNLSALTPTTMVHPNPEPYPNFDSHLKANINNVKPQPPDADDGPGASTNPTRTPGKEGNVPDINPRHSAWELGMLLGSSAGLGMVLVVGLRYMYSQACGKRTEVTLNDREREYARGERGLVHVQECGDLVRVRRIRDNSFVFLAEYDILTPPGD